MMKWYLCNVALEKKSSCFDNFENIIDLENLLQNIPDSNRNFFVTHMQGYQINNGLFTADNLKCITVNSYPQDALRQKNFANGLQNARNILSDLQESLEETRRYESRLMRCRSSHAHSHVTEWWESDLEGYDMKCSKTDTETLRNGVLAESWSTMSIVCLQYQYEELSKRYKSLLEAYDERCRAVCAKDAQIAQLQEIANSTQAQLLNALKTVIAVGEKYLAMRQRKRVQKCWYSKRVRMMKSKLRSLLVAAERAWQELDARLARAMTTERRSGTALLLAEIRKYNHLCLENLHLKTRIHALTQRAD